jgi:hypothetical protein
MKTCPRCGTDNPDYVTACQKCRINLEWALAHPDVARAEPYGDTSQLAPQTNRPTSAGAGIVQVTLGFLATGCSLAAGYVVYQAASWIDRSASVSAVQATQVYSEATATLLVIVCVLLMFNVWMQILGAAHK